MTRVKKPSYLQLITSNYKQEDLYNLKGIQRTLVLEVKNGFDSSTNQKQKTRL